MTWVLAILALGFLIVVHEAGHYFVARRCRMRVERFSIGFPLPRLPALFSRRSKKTGTQFQLNPLPFGGFVEIRGMNIAEDVDPTDREAYPNRPAWQRFLTIFAGPATNYLSAIVLAFGLYACYGMRSVERWYTVAETKPGFAAHGQLKDGDRILAIDGVPILARLPDGKLGPALSDRVNAARGRAVTLRIRRDSKQLELVLQPKPVQTFLAVSPSYRLGIELAMEADRVEVGIGEAALGALRYPVDKTQEIMAGLYDVINGDEPFDPGGPVRIAREFNRAFSAGWIYGVQLVMVLSVYIGLFNLFPLPALDGGRLVFLGYEMVTRRRANPRVETTVHMIGILLLLIIMVLVTFRDCRGCFA